MTIEILYQIPLWIIFITMVTILLAASYFFYYIGQKAQKQHPERNDSINELLPTSIFGLLALLLGFSFSMSIARYDTRKTLSMKEANAIGTTYLRTDNLPENTGFQIRQLLKDYTKHRLIFFEHQRIGLKGYNQRTQDLQNQIWKLAAGVTRTDRGPLIAIFMQSLNEMIDLSSERAFASENHVPEIVHHMIFLIAFIGLSSLSYVSGFKNQRRLAPVFLSLLFPLVIALILDLDRPGRGLIRVTQTNMLELYDSIHNQE
ncbi:bestrophin-like domain [Bdellovibrio svalbardensis]|uniref:DUF4239 domain-containing protein n=1 Tax=Bdellovibrio svalbardensis TaxID=2972972 RepID=A0ABT6DNJ3_9BACT|nr:hypothetical protein [Bdellovibrio svalbardensis]MDG0817504.1 hypothetical protein [Bdellovibrio svalbardensis]